MTKGPSPQAPRPERPELPRERLPWREPGPGDSPRAAPCATPKEASVALLQPIAGEHAVIAVPVGGAVRLIADGLAMAVLEPALGDEIVTCMAEGWRYAGTLVPLAPHVGRVTLEARRLL